MTHNSPKMVTILEIVYMGAHESNQCEFIGVFDNDDDLNAAEFIGLQRHRGKLEKSRKTTVPLNYLNVTPNH